MSLIRKDLPSPGGKAVGDNKLNSYFPVRTNDRRGDIDWGAVIGFVIKLIYREEIALQDVDEFREKCRADFTGKLDDSGFWEYLEKMYFDNDGIYKIIPEFLLFKVNKEKGNKLNTRLGKMYASLLQGEHIDEAPKAKLNFIEQNLVNVLNENINKIDGKDASININEHAYLPFLSRVLSRDLKLLSEHPKYFLGVLSQFVRLYAYLYTAQLALNIGGWREGEPFPKPVYFILDSETASAERTHIRDDGHQRVHSALYKIFPYLSMSESLQESKGYKYPLWYLAKNIDDTSYEQLRNYAEAFKQERKLDYEVRDSGNIHDVLDDLLKIGESQFYKGQSRHGINNRYVEVIESELCNHFIKSRGRGGKVLVINQDYLLLLTNLSIGVNKKLRFHELLSEFKKRGVFFDKKSQQALIQFYERIGNVERMSDTGDAVYVCRTI